MSPQLSPDHTSCHFRLLQLDAQSDYLLVHRQGVQAFSAARYSASVAHILRVYSDVSAKAARPRRSNEPQREQGEASIARRAIAWQASSHVDCRTHAEAGADGEAADGADGLRGHKTERRPVSSCTRIQLFELLVQARAIGGESAQSSRQVARRNRGARSASLHDNQRREDGGEQSGRHNRASSDWLVGQPKRRGPDSHAVPSAEDAIAVG